jgi:hypothetical protein
MGQNAYTYFRALTIVALLALIFPPASPAGQLAHDGFTVTYPDGWSYVALSDPAPRPTKPPLPAGLHYRNDLRPIGGTLILQSYPADEGQAGYIPAGGASIVERTWF